MCSTPDETLCVPYVARKDRRRRHKNVKLSNFFIQQSAPRRASAEVGEEDAAASAHGASVNSAILLRDYERSPGSSRRNVWHGGKDPTSRDFPIASRKSRSQDRSSSRFFSKLVQSHLPVCRERSIDINQRMTTKCDCKVQSGPMENVTAERI